MADPRVDGVAILASYAAGSTDVESMAGAPVLLLTGSEDRVAPEEFFPEWERFREPRWGGGDRRDEVDLGLALPLELQLLTERRLRAPVLVEAGFGGDLGPVELGVRGGFGPVLSEPGALGFLLQWSLWVRVPELSPQ